jgi:hypothetical protein
MTLEQLYKELEKHDWYYRMSDDHRSYTSGYQNEFRLRTLARAIEGGTELFNRYRDWKRSGSPMGTNQLEKPELI